MMIKPTYAIKEKQLIIIAFFTLLSVLNGCTSSINVEMKPTKSISEIISGQVATEEINIENQEIDTDVQLSFYSKRHNYNEIDPDKNLLLQFINDEIPIISYIKEGEIVYFSDISDIGDINEKRYYIADMNGDGKQDFCYINLPVIDIVVYNEEKECFELWLSERHQQRPIGNGQMYAEDFHELNSYEYLVYDEQASLITHNGYMIGEIGKNGVSCMVYQIILSSDGEIEDVSKEEWYAETAYLFELIENAPEPLSYKDLLGDTNFK